jgi:hypothetical protein
MNGVGIFRDALKRVEQSVKAKAKSAGLRINEKNE